MGKLDMSTTRRRLKSPRSLSSTFAHLTMVTLVNIIGTNEWLTSFTFRVNRPSHSRDKVISDSDHETPRSRSWMWSKCKVIQSAKYLLPRFLFVSIRPTITEIQLFRNLTLRHPRSRSRVRLKVKVTYITKYPTVALSFLLALIRPTIPKIWPK